MTIRERLRELFYNIYDENDDISKALSMFINSIESEYHLIPKKGSRVIECDKMGCCSECPILHSSGSCPVDDFTENTNRVNRVIIVEKEGGNENY